MQEEEACSIFTLEKGLELRCWCPEIYEDGVGVSVIIYDRRKESCGVYDAKRFILDLNID